MKYIINDIISFIMETAPSSDKEVLVKVDSFEDIRIYEIVAEQLTSIYGGRLKLDIKLAKKRYDYYNAVLQDKSYLQEMYDNGWVATEESVTYYRNRHDANLLVLLGTEDEEDRDGLLNVATVSPAVIIERLKGNYHLLFTSNAVDFTGDEAHVNNLFKYLFNCVPLDICKLSDWVDLWEKEVSDVADLVRVFYRDLPTWGIPLCQENLPSIKQDKKNERLIGEAYKFINRTRFKRLTEGAFQKNYQRKVEQYESKKKEFSSIWGGWNSHPLNSYNNFTKVLLDYIKGLNIKENRQKLLYADLSITKDVLDIKTDTPIIDPKKKTNKILGDPLLAFTETLLEVFVDEMKEPKGLTQVEFRFNKATLVNMYSDNDLDAQDQIITIWLNICRHTNGVFEYLNNRFWNLNDDDISVVCSDADFFSCSKASQYIQNGTVNPATKSAKLHKIEFEAILHQSAGNSVIKYEWLFSENEPWLQMFSELGNVHNINKFMIESGYGVVPLACTNDMDTLIAAKSSEEFFDLYADTSFDLNTNLIRNKNTGQNISTKFFAEFQRLGDCFSKLIYNINYYGYYKTLVDHGDYFINFFHAYRQLGEHISKTILSESDLWVLDSYIYSFCVVEDVNPILQNGYVDKCIVPPWHPATLEKINDQKLFFLEGCTQWLYEKVDLGHAFTDKDISKRVFKLHELSEIRSSLDVFPMSQGSYYGCINSFGGYSLYAADQVIANPRLKDILKKDEVFDDDFTNTALTRMSDDSKMISDVLFSYAKTFDESKNNLDLVFINPVDLQPIVASVYNFIETIKKDVDFVNVRIRILVKPENMGGRNYLAYWLNEFFAEDDNVFVKAYLNIYTSANDLKRLDSNNDIIFVFNLLEVDSYGFAANLTKQTFDYEDCKFPIIYKPVPLSRKSRNRKIELSQPQFENSYIHTQLAYVRHNHTFALENRVIATKELKVNDDKFDTIVQMHEKAYWIVCIDSGIDGSLLKSKMGNEDFSIIGFSTGKGSYGQYNLTITARQSILNVIRKKLKARLKMMFAWKDEEVESAVERCIEEASELDGISMLSAINRKDYEINEFLAYILTSLREKEKSSTTPLRIIIHLDSYMHWFNDDSVYRGSDTKSRPDFLIMEVDDSLSDKVNLKATVVECKIASESNAHAHIEKALGQVKHGLERLSALFDPNSSSILRRHWRAQLYRALVFAQITYSDDTDDYIRLVTKLRTILDGNYEISWNGIVLGYWLDMMGDNEISEMADDSNINVYHIPQKRVQRLLLNKETVDFTPVSQEMISNEEIFEENAKSQRLYNKQREERINKHKDRINIVIDDVHNETDSKNVVDTNDTRPVIENDKKDSDTLHNDQIEDTKPSISPINSQDDIKNNHEEASKHKKPEIVNPKDIRVFIGEDRLKQKVYWEFGNPKLSNRHLLITGTSGQGKTYSIQTMLYELSKRNISAVVFDYTEGFRLDQLEKPFIEKMTDHISQRVVYFNGVPVNPFKRQNIEVAGMERPEKTSDVATRIANIFKHVYSFGDQQFSAIYQATKKGLDRYGKSMDFNLFREGLENLDMAQAKSVLSKMTPFLDSVVFKNDEDFDWGDLLYSNEPIVFIFQLTNFTREIQVIITELLLWDAWYYTKKRGNKDKPFVVVLDEAQNLSHKDNSPSASILVEGRKFGWSAWYATQSLDILSDEEVVRLSQAAFKLYFRPTDKEIPKVSKLLDPVDSKQWLDPLKRLNKGECIVAGNRMLANGKFGSTKPTTTKVASFEKRDENE